MISQATDLQDAQDLTPWHGRRHCFRSYQSQTCHLMPPSDGRDRHHLCAVYPHRPRLPTIKRGNLVGRIVTFVPCEAVQIL
jgi:hypothetical protein